VDLLALQLSPLDVLYIAEGGDRAQAAELEQRLAYHLRRDRRPPGVPADAAIRLLFGRDFLQDSDGSFAELLELARAARTLVTGARPATARDLALPDRGAGESLDLADLAGRADTTVRQFQEAAAALDAAAAAANAGAVDPLREALLRIAAFGVPGSVPLAAGNDIGDRLTLIEQGGGAGRECGRRLAAVAKVEQGGGDGQVRYHLARLREIFGAAFCALPAFRVPNAVEVNDAFAASDTVQGGSPWPAATWLHRAARVREGVARLTRTLTYAEAQWTGLKANLKVAQLPFAHGDRWLALTLPDAAPRDELGGRVSVVAHLPVDLDAAQPMCGLVVDEWVEVIPGATELTGVAFHFDEPGSRAPQAVLLAVPPDDRPAWDVESLASVVLQTLELAKLRTVDLDVIGEGGHVLPGLYLAFNAAGATVSSDVSHLAGPPS
jgi:hypothetical protein